MSKRSLKRIKPKEVTKEEKVEIVIEKVKEEDKRTPEQKRLMKVTGDHPCSYYGKKASK